MASNIALMYDFLWPDYDVIWMIVDGALIVVSCHAIIREKSEELAKLLSLIIMEMQIQKFSAWERGRFPR